jgi:hypothetical protein
MSENATAEGINININNSDSNQGGSSGVGGILERLFDIGLKLIIPVGLIIALLAVIIIVRVIIPLVDFVGDVDIPLALLPGPLGLIAGVGGTLFGWLAGR